VSSGPALARKATFRHGVHPAEMKEATEGLVIERMPFVDEYVLPLSQHTGAPSRPLVAPGMRVKRGQIIAAPDGYISTALHSPVTGSVTEIGLRPHPNGQNMPAIVIRTDPFSSQRIEIEGVSPDGMPVNEIVRRVQEAGIVGLGGAAFPSHVKLQLPEGKKAKFVVLNGCECEPYLTCDHRIMAERPEAVLWGLRLIMDQVQAGRGYIGVEKNKPDAIEELRKQAAQHGDIEIVPLEVKYPQGAEKMLIDAIFHKEVPSGKLPLDLEIVVNNVGTATALYDLFQHGQPLIERVVTLTGPGIRRPANLLVPLGTPLGEVIDYCGGLDPATRQVIFGGPMMGLAQKRLDVPVIKGVSGVLALTSRIPVVREEACIRCGRCLDACPMFLNPSRLAQLVRYERVDELPGFHIMDCFECASCSFSCPSNIPLVQMIRVGKAMVRAKGRKG
jgi:electron transport complex protein RnfC